MTFGSALIYSLLGICVVFFALVLLMVIIRIMTAVSDLAEKKTAPVAPAAPVAPVATAVGGIPAPDMSAPVQTLKAYAPGSAGELKLYDTDPRTAAMLMAIVADELKAPINELRFISIREIKEDDQV